MIAAHLYQPRSRCETSAQAHPQLGSRWPRPPRTGAGFGSGEEMPPRLRACPGRRPRRRRGEPPAPLPTRSPSSPRPPRGDPARSVLAQRGAQGGRPDGSSRVRGSRRRDRRARAGRRRAPPPSPGPESLPIAGPPQAGADSPRRQRRDRPLPTPPDPGDAATPARAAPLRAAAGPAGDALGRREDARCRCFRAGSSPGPTFHAIAPDGFGRGGGGGTTRGGSECTQVLHLTTTPPSGARVRIIQHLAPSSGRVVQKKLFFFGGLGLNPLPGKTREDRWESGRISSRQRGAEGDTARPLAKKRKKPSDSVSARPGPPNRLERLAVEARLDLVRFGSPSREGQGPTGGRLQRRPGCPAQRASKLLEELDQLQVEQVTCGSRRASRGVLPWWAGGG